MTAVDIRSLGRDDVVWPFREGPYLSHGPYTRTDIDPFPAYPHDEHVVREQVRALVGLWPPGGPLTYWISDLEDLSRTNGWADRNDWTDGYESWHAHVFVSGKRIPPHPAVTRYVVAHEYGHHVAWWLGRALGVDATDDSFMREYGEMRGLDDVWGHGGEWHRAPGEVFACDFRILVADVERRYWPHPGVSRPESSHVVVTWWADARRYWCQLMRPPAVAA